MIAKKNASINLQAERQMHVQNGFLVISALVCAAFAWRSPLAQKALIEDTYAKYKPIAQDDTPTPKKKEEPLKIIQTDSKVAVLNVANLVDENTITVKSTSNLDSSFQIPVDAGGFTTDPKGVINTVGGPGDVVINEEIIDEIPDKEAQPLIGMPGLKKYVIEHIVYPEISIENEDEGKVYVEFVVEKNGTMSGIKIARGVTEELNKEAIRIVKNFGTWIPGESNGRTVRSKFRYVIDFVLTK